MREILFKAKRIDNGEWVVGFYQFSDWIYPTTKELAERKYYIRPIRSQDAFEVSPNTICQYTGLTDKNGNKIWENDIVKYHFGEDAAVVRYGKYQNCFDSQKACHVGFYVDWQDCKRKDLGYWVEMIDCNVIGNIFDNADLVKEQ